MKILMIMLSGVMLVNSQDMSKEKLEVITGTQVVVQGKIPVVAKKVTTSVKKATPTKKKTTKKKVVKKKTTKKKVKKKVVKKAYKSVKKTKQSKKIAKKVQKKKIKYNYRYNVGEIQSYIQQKIYEYGWTENDYYSIVQIVNRESSFNPYAVNKKSGACGLFQAYPCSKMAKYGSDYRTNYKVQVSWGMDYIKARYGSPSQAWSFWQKHHWY